MPRTFPLVQLDVFAQRPLEGNQLAVCTDARGLSDAEMQQLAHETNLSETTFILPRDAETERERGFKVRIFTVAEELEFAGHPTLGTAWYLADKHNLDKVELDLRVGKIPVTFRRENGLLTFGEMRQRDPQFGSIMPAEDVARALGIPLQAIDTSLPIQTVSTGMPFAMVPLRSLAEIRKLSFSWAQASEYLAKTDAKFFYVVTRETEAADATLHARMIFYNGEDPATGSAAGCCTGWAVRHGVLASDKQGMIEQGIEIRRPSYIYIRATRDGDSVTNVRVGGAAVQVMRGEVTL